MEIRINWILFNKFSVFNISLLSIVRFTQHPSFFRCSGMSEVNPPGIFPGPSKPAHAINRE